MRQPFDPLAEHPPLRQTVIPALLVYSLELPIIGRHPCGQLEANGVGIQHAQVVFGSRIILISGNQFLHNLDHARIGVSDVRAIKVEFGDSMHSALTRHEIKEVIALRFRPCLHGKREVELHDDAGQKLVVSCAWVGGCQCVDAVGYVSCAFARVGLHGVF